MSGIDVEYEPASRGIVIVVRVAAKTARLRVTPEYARKLAARLRELFGGRK